MTSTKSDTSVLDTILSDSPSKQNIQVLNKEKQELDETTEELLTKTNRLKNTILDTVKETLETQKEYLEARELKQLADITLAIEASVIKGPKEQSGVNVLIQNMMQEYGTNV